MSRNHINRIDVPLRIFGSVLVVVAYFIVLYIDVTVGVVLGLIGDVVALPFFIRTRAWDVVVMIGFLSCVSISKLAQVLLA